MPKDRDQLFERALARQLRADAADSASACLDPETLAAYHERLLSAEEMATAKDHLVGCTRCQEILARLELTQDLAGKEEQQATSAVARSAAPASPSAKPQAKVSEFSAKKGTTLRWAAPLGAIAAVLLLLIGDREFRKEAPASKSVTQIADNRKSQDLREHHTQPDTLPSEERQKAAEVFNDLKEQAEPSPSRGARETEPQNGPAKEAPALRARADSLSKDDRGFGSGAGNGPVVKSKQAEEVPAAPALNAADSAKPGEVLGGIVGGAMAKKAAPPAPPKTNYKAETEPPERDKLAYSAGQPGAAANARVSRAVAPAPPPPPAPSQGPSQLRGTVTDPSGAVIPRAQVALKSENGSTVAQTSTDSGGAYTFNGVAAGNYRLELQSPGFKTDTITGLNVAPGANVQNAQLQVGASAETVEVSAQATQLQTSATSSASLQTEVSSLSVMARNETQLKTLDRVALTNSAMPPFAAAAPGGKNQWRFGDLGVIFHSSDAGATWHSQISGVTAKLAAGSATSDKVCWIAGASGTLLRTTDGGKHWRRITVPLTGDLGGVHATDARHATIWDAPNQLRYETSDGGASWQQTPNQ